MYKIEIDLRRNISNVYYKITQKLKMGFSIHLIRYKHIKVALLNGIKAIPYRWQNFLHFTGNDLFVGNYTGSAGLKIMYSKGIRNDLFKSKFKKIT